MKYQIFKQKFSEMEGLNFWGGGNLNCVKACS